MSNFLADVKISTATIIAGIVVLVVIVSGISVISTLYLNRRSTLYEDSPSILKTETEQVDESTSQSTNLSNGSAHHNQTVY